MALHHQLDELVNRALPVVQDFHRRGMFSPHAATIDASGSVAGHALTTDGSTQLSVAQAIEHFEQKFSGPAGLNEIQGAGIFYHSPGIATSEGRVSLPPATTTDECRTLVALLEHAAGDSVCLLASSVFRRAAGGRIRGRQADREASKNLHPQAASRKQTVVEALVTLNPSLQRTASPSAELARYA